MKHRGEIAIRILNTARELGIETYTLSTPGDTSHTPHSHAIPLPSPSSYLDDSLILSLAQKHFITHIHPGYGFLSESPHFSRLAAHASPPITIIGPGWETLARTGDKLAARMLAEECNVPVLHALGEPTGEGEKVRRWVKRSGCGYPVIIKAVDGGGGRGIRIVRSEEELDAGVRRALAESPQGAVFVEKAAVDGFRHVEVQIIGDGHSVRHLWERECSIQRRFQKVVEFAPSSIRDRGLVARVIEAAVRMAKAVNYLSLGTFEFLVHESRPEFYFLEVNPRLQVEHTITESLVPGLDLVRLQLQIAAGAQLRDLLAHVPKDPRRPPPLHSMQLRICAEDAAHNWSLSVGKITGLSLPTGHGVRVDTHLVPNLVVKTDFDSLLAKVIVTAASWPEVLAKARRALEDTRIEGVATTLPALRGIIAHPEFASQHADTRWLEGHLEEVLRVGMELTKALPVPQKEAAQAPLVNAQGGTTFRRGDAWAVTLQPSGAEKEKVPPAHFQIQKVLRNDFPSQLSVEVVYTPPGAEAQQYTLSLNSTTASSSSHAAGAKHRQGDKNDPSHVVIPFPGTLVEVCIDEGDVVRRNDTIAVVRQMKMELEIRASRDGVVEWVTDIEDGEEVGEGTLAAVVKDEPAPKL